MAGLFHAAQTPRYGWIIPRCTNSPLWLDYSMLSKLPHGWLILYYANSPAMAGLLHSGAVVPIFTLYFFVFTDLALDQPE